jgi:hypothetical protein
MIEVKRRRGENMFKQLRIKMLIRKLVKVRERLELEKSILSLMSNLVFTQSKKEDVLKHEEDIKGRIRLFEAQKMYYHTQLSKLLGVSKEEVEEKVCGQNA